MFSSLIVLLTNEILTRQNYATWKSNLNMILVIDDLRFVLIEVCPQILARNATQTIRGAYDQWTKANKKV